MLIPCQFVAGITGELALGVLLNGVLKMHTPIVLPRTNFRKLAEILNLAGDCRNLSS